MESCNEKIQIISYHCSFPVNVFLEITQTLSCLRKALKTEGLDQNAGKIVTIRDHTENGIVMVTPMKQRDRASKFLANISLWIGVNYKIF